MPATIRPFLVLALGVLLAGALGACESTQEKSARLAAQAKGLKVEKGLTVGAANPDVKVAGTAVVADANGTAVVVELQNSGGPQADVPVLIEVLDGGGRSLFKNDVPGLQRSLTHASLVPSGGDMVWVNDQVVAAGTPAKVEAQVGKAEQPAPKSDPKLTVEKVTVETDATSGVQAVGVVRNGGSAEQQRVIVAVVARKGGEVTAAGRGIVQKIKAGGTGTFRAFLIGDAKGAKLAAVASPGAEGEALGKGPSEGDVQTGAPSS